MSEPELQIRVIGGVGRITLDRPKALNALSLGMVRGMTEALLAWQDDPAVAIVIVDGAGERAFCAGGDIRALATSGKAGDGAALAFWSEEYVLDQLIARYPKPYVALIDGVTMGGGVGISAHGAWRIAGDRTLIAMPETGIGFFPDVGGCYLLPRLPDRIGYWMGLTGARLGAADALATGLATHFVPTERRGALLAALEAAAHDTDGEVLEAILADHEAEPGPSTLHAVLPTLTAAFSAPTVEAVFAALGADGGAWAQAQLDALKTKSPTSLKLTWAALARGAEMELEAVLEQDVRVALRCLEGADFYEGVRAVVIDKDNAPSWRPARLEDVEAAAIEAHFAPVPGLAPLPFRLPAHDPADA